MLTGEGCRLRLNRVLATFAIQNRHTGTKKTLVPIISNIVIDGVIMDKGSFGVLGRDFGNVYEPQPEGFCSVINIESSAAAALSGSAPLTVGADQTEKRFFRKGIEF